MTVEELKAAIDAAPLSDRAALSKLYLYLTCAGEIKSPYASLLDAADTYQAFLTSVFMEPAFKDSLEWAEIAKLNRRNWLAFFEPKLKVEHLRMRTDGLPVQMGSAVMLAPTGSRDNIATLYVFESKGFNANAADFVTSLGGRFTIADWEFFGIYGLYKYRGNVILEEWEPEADPVYAPQN